MGMDRLQKLVFSFYREDLFMQKKLQPLLSCRMTRCKGNILIECLDKRHFLEVSQLIGLVSVPIAELSLCNELVLSAPGQIRHSFPINNSFHTEILP